MVERTMDLFEAFNAAKKPMSLTTLAKAIGLPVSSCHGLVHTLRQRGYLYSVSFRQGSYPTRRLLDIAQSIVKHDPLLDRLQPLLDGLNDNCGETVILGKRQKDGVVYLEVVEGIHTVRYVAQAGDQKPFHSSAIGKAALSRMKDDEFRHFIESDPLARITPNTISNPQGLAEEIELGRKQGFFVTRGENVVDVMAIAVPFTCNGEVYGIAIAGPINRMEPQLPLLIELLHDVHDALDERLVS
jgi:IclR family acetate operon transcriptional repressor